MATTTKKNPQDHKPSNEQIFEDLDRDFSEVEGSELLVPLSKIKGSDQMRLMGRLQKLGITGGGDDETVDSDSFDLDAFADLIDWVSERFAVNPAKFDEWSGGVDGMNRTMTLLMAFMTELGKGMNSDAS